MSGSVQVAYSGTANSGGRSAVGLSPTVAAAVREKHPWIACMLHGGDSVDHIQLDWEGVMQCSQLLPSIFMPNASQHGKLYGGCYAVCKVEAVTPGMWRVSEVPAPGDDQQQFEPPSWARAWQDALSAALAPGAGSGAHTEAVTWLRSA